MKSSAIDTARPDTDRGGGGARFAQNLRHYHDRLWPRPTHPAPAGAHPLPRFPAEISARSDERKIVHAPFGAPSSVRSIQGNADRHGSGRSGHGGTGLSQPASAVAGRFAGIGPAVQPAHHTADHRGDRGEKTRSGRLARAPCRPQAPERAWARWGSAPPGPTRLTPPPPPKAQSC